MTKLFGRTACNEERDWDVMVEFTSGEEFNLTEQLNEEEATDFFNKIKEKMADKESFIEVVKDRGTCRARTYIIPKANITYIRLN